MISELLTGAGPAELRAAARALLATPSLEELDKRSLMARLIKLHPELHTLLTGGGDDRPTALIVSWTSLEKRKLELDDSGQQTDSQEHRGNFHRALLRRFARKL